MTELIHCPFCGEDEAELDEIYMDHRDESNISRQIVIRCGYCGVTFFTDDKKEDMLKSWNSRCKKIEKGGINSLALDSGCCGGEFNIEDEDSGQ